MPRNISFALTTEQFRDRSKTVTRRIGWWKDKNGKRLVKVGDILNGCVKCMGLKPGEKIERLGQIRITDVRREPLDFMETCDGLGERLTDVCEVIIGNTVNYPADYVNIEAAKEGFPGLTGSEFVKMFCRHMGVDADQMVTRIEFEYLSKS